MFYRKVVFSVLGVVLLVVAFFLFITPRGGTHTYYDNVFSESVIVQSFKEKLVTVSLENVTRYQLFLGGYKISDVSFTILDPNKNELSVLGFRELPGGAGDCEFITNNAGNYTIHLTGDDQENFYNVDLRISERIDEYYPQGGRYGSINNLLKNIQAAFIAIVGIVIILTVFWKDHKKPTQSINYNLGIMIKSFQNPT